MIKAGSMATTSERARAQIRVLEERDSRKRVILSTIIVGLFILNVLVLWRLIDNHGHIF